MQEYTAAPVEGLDLACEHGEGPICDPRTGDVLWVDGTAGDLHAVDLGRPGASLRSVHPAETVAAFARPHAAGGYVVAADNAVVHLPELSAAPVGLAVVPEPDGVWVNEGTVDPWGRFWVGSMTWEDRPGTGTLWCWTGRGPVVPVLTGVTISNGLDWSPDRSRAYYVDTPTQSVDVLTLDEDGGPAAGVPRVATREPLVRIDPADGSPDGLIVDDEGAVWVALWGGSAIHRYSPAGELLARVSVPVDQPSAVCFAGPERDLLVVTTSQQGLDEDALARQPDAGRLFACRVGVSGPPARVFTPA